MTDSQNPNVITTWNSHSDRTVYHTTACRHAWRIREKRYIPEADARRRGMEKCDYCANDFVPKNGTEDRDGQDQTYERVRELGERLARVDAGPEVSLQEQLERVREAGD